MTILWGRSMKRWISKQAGMIIAPQNRLRAQSGSGTVNKDDFLDDEEKKEDTLDFKIKTSPQGGMEVEKQKRGEKTQEPEKTVPPVERGKDDKEFSLSDDRFDSDSLFEDKPAGKLRKEDHLSLFDDDPDEELAQKPSSSDLFSDNQSLGKKPESKPAEKSSKPKQDDFLKELFGDSKTGLEEEAEEKKGIYFRKKVTGEVVGPFDEGEIEKLMLNGVISEEDDISYDGFSWTSSDGSLQPKTTSRPSPSYGLSLDDDEGEAFDSLSFDKGPGMSDTGVFKDAANEFEDTSFTSAGAQNQHVDHIFIPDEFSEEKMEKTGHSKKSKKGRKGDSPVLFYAVLTFSTLIVLGLIGGGFYYYLKYVKGTQGDILDNISESIAVNTGTLVDVRESLNKDLPDDYINSVGILKQYLKSEDSAPSAVGLDGQVKFNLLISYNRRLEPSATLNEKIDAAMKKAPGNLDLTKAKALSLYESKMFDEALVLIQPFAESSDQEIFYILGLIAQAKKDMQKAEMFFNQGFMQGGGKNSKIIYALAEMKYRNGDAQSAMAFLNRIIADNPNYLKAHLLKASIIMNIEGKLEEADSFLKSVSANIISKAEDFQKADYYHKLATVAHKRGLMKEAVGYYEKAVEINKTDTSSITTIADFYVQISNSSKAMEYYDMALKIDPKYPPAILGKTEIYILLGQNDKVYLEIAKLDIKSIVDAPALIRLGRIYYKIGDKGKSMEFYDLAIKSNPSLIEPYLAKVVILLEFKKIKEIDAIAAVVEKLGQETYAFNLIKAVVQHEEANYKRAEEYFKKAAERNTTGDERVFYYYGVFPDGSAELSRIVKNARKGI
jgi:tetratricopeptide (TPR) repeat protein